MGNVGQIAAAVPQYAELAQRIPEYVKIGGIAALTFGALVIVMMFILLIFAGLIYTKPTGP